MNFHKMAAQSHRILHQLARQGGLKALTAGQQTQVNGVRLRRGERIAGNRAAVHQHIRRVEPGLQQTQQRGMAAPGALQQRNPDLAGFFARGGADPLHRLILTY